jgi:hypothetical protein
MRKHSTSQVRLAKPGATPAFTPAKKGFIGDDTVIVEVSD